MRKAFILLFLSLCSSLSATYFIPVKRIQDNDIFQSPALLAAEDNENNFSIDVKSYADFDMLEFFSDPASVLTDAAYYLRDFILDKDDQYLLDNYDSIKNIFSFDPGFPSKHQNVSENAHYIREYLNKNFENIGKGNRARAVLNALSSNLSLFPQDTSSLVDGNLDLSLALNWNGISDGFGWKGGVDIVYDGASSLLDSFSYSGYDYGSTLYFTLGASVGYGTYVSDKVAVGISFTPRFIFRTTTLNTSLLESRISGSFIQFLASNRFDFGAAIELDFGLMLNAGENARILLDFRSLPSIEMFWYFSASDVMENFSFHEDENIYYSMPDIAVGVIWEKGSMEMKAEISSIMSQVLLVKKLPFYSFDILSIPRFSFTYGFSDMLSVEAGYRERQVYAKIMYSFFNAEFSTRVDRPGIGFSAGFEF